MSKRNPWIYIPTLYFAEGLPYTVVMMMSAVYFKDLGADNALIGLSSSLALPWSFKFAWAPLIDFFGRKKMWIVVAQMVLCALFALLGFSCFTPSPVQVAFVVMALCALASATHDAAIDGYYLEVLDKPKQALFVGVRNTAYRMSMIFGSGGMVYLAGVLTPTMGKETAWFWAFEVGAIVMAIAFGLHNFYLPDRGSAVAEKQQDKEAMQAVPVAAAATQTKADTASIPTNGSSDSSNAENNQSDASSAESAEDPQQTAEYRNYFKAILSYFNQPGIVAIVFYILLFRLGDAMVVKMITPFLQDTTAKGGLALSLKEVGTIYGTVGVGFLLLGGIIGGYLVSKQGLKRWFWPATLIMNGTILLYWMLAFFRPDSIAWVYVVNSLEQFGYGMGMAAYTVFLLTTVRPEYKAAHYAVATAMMAQSLMIPGMISGFLCDSVGYANFFLISFCATIPGVISIFFLPIWRKEEQAAV